MMKPGSFDISHKWRWIFMLILFLTRPICSWADLGDSLDDCIRQYGQPLEHEKGNSTNAGLESYDFKQGALNINETFGKSLRIVIIENFWKDDHSPLSESEVQAILKGDPFGKVWTKSKTEASTWSNGVGQAFYDTNTKELGIFTTRSEPYQTAPYPSDKTKYVTVYGSGVPAPGRFPWKADLHLSESLIRAGGFDGNPSVYLIRKEQRSKINIRLILLKSIPDPILLPGDQVEVNQGTI